MKHLAIALLGSCTIVAGQQSISNAVATFAYDIASPTYGFLPLSLSSLGRTVNFRPHDPWVVHAWDGASLPPNLLSLRGVVPSSCVFPAPVHVQTSDSFEVTYGGVTEAALGLDFDVRIRGSLAAGSPDVDLDIRVTLNNQPNFGLFAVDFPRFRLDQGEPSELAWPRRSGITVQSPATSSHIFPDEAPASVYDLRFAQSPGLQSMQWLSLQRNGTESILWMTKDVAGHHKGFQVLRSTANSNELHCAVRNYPEDNKVARSYTTPYKASFTVLPGGWYECAKHYRDWAVPNMRTCQSGTMEANPELSSYVRDADVFAWWQPERCPGVAPHFIYNSFLSLPTMMQDLKTALALPTDAPSVIYHWDYNSFDGRWGDWLPANGDYATGSAGTSQPVGAYFLPSLFDTSVPGFTGFLDRATLLDVTNLPLILPPTLAGLKQGRTCGDPASTSFVNAAGLSPAAWQTEAYLHAYAEHLHLVADADGLYLDAFAHADAFLSYATNHGHSPGGGNWYSTSSRNLVKSTRDYVRNHHQRDFFMVSEGVSETNMDRLDAGIWSSVVDEAGRVYPAPLFRTVFHDYHRIVGFGLSVLPTSVGAPPFAGTLTRQHQAVNLFMGGMPWIGGILSSTENLATMRTRPEVDRIVTMLENASEVITKPGVRQLYVFGERMRDFIDTGSGTVSAGGMGFQLPYGPSQPLVYGSSFRYVDPATGSASAGLLLVNWTHTSDAAFGVTNAGPRTTSFQIAAADLGLPAQPGYTETVWAPGQLAQVTVNVDLSSPLAINVTVPESSAVFIRWH